MADLTQYSKGELVNFVERSKAMARRAKMHTEAVTSRGTKTLVSGAAGYAVGLAKNKAGNADGQLFIPGTKIEADLAAGALLSLAGILGLGGSKNDELLAAGNGVLAGYAAIAGFKNGLPGAER